MKNEQSGSRKRRGFILKGKEIERLREEKGFYSRRAFAEAVGCSAETINRAENGQPVDQLYVRKIATKLGVIPETLFALEQTASECSSESHHASTDKQPDLDQKPEFEPAESITDTPAVIDFVKSPEADKDETQATGKHPWWLSRRAAVLPLAAAVIISVVAYARWAGGGPAKKVAPTPSVRTVPPANSDNPPPKEIVTDSGIKMILIPPGTFWMGADPDDPKAVGGDIYVERPQHKVRISRPYYLGVYEITQGQYFKVTGERHGKFQSSEDLPVETLYWYSAIRFCNRLSVSEHIKPFYDINAFGDIPLVTIPDPDGIGYRLPTEAEWEYACRGTPLETIPPVKQTWYGFADDENQLHRYAWFDGKAGTHPVGQKLPNKFGLYDMHGNVWEWCWDWYDAKYYASSPDTDPSGPPTGKERVRRGGSWNMASVYARSAFRGMLPPDKGEDDIGFRVARTVKKAD